MKSPYAILIVDDEESICKLLKSRFEREEYQVYTAANAEQATQMVADHSEIAVVVTDVKMPGKSGIELTKELRTSAQPKKVIVMTGHGEKSTAIDALRLGASDFVEKPFNVEEMAHAVARTVGEYTLERENEVYVQKLRSQTPFIDLNTVSNVIPLKREFAAHAEEKLNFTVLKKKWTDQFEQDFISKLLNKHKGNVTAAAKEAGLDRSNFLRLLRRHQIQAQVYRKAA